MGHDDELRKPTIGDGSADTSTTNEELPVDVRQVVGTGMDKFTHVVNNNLIAARYGIFASVTLLTVYGLSQTPLFFRYRTVANIPASSFISRRRLYGRIIGVETVESVTGGTGDIRIHMRHLSPMGQILPKSWFDFLVKFSPYASRLGSGSVHGKPEQDARDLLKIKIAGIHPPPVSRLTFKPEEHLKRLASERALISCQLLARQVDISSNNENADSGKISKRPMAEVMPELAAENSDTTSRIGFSLPGSRLSEVAICKVRHRPSLFQLFPTDVAESLIASGNASVSSNILGREDTDSQHSTIKDSSQKLQDLRNDVKYLDRLAKAELEAAGKSNGMWSVPEVREAKREVVDEVDFQAKANTLQKVWRWFRGG